MSLQKKLMQAGLMSKKQSRKLNQKAKKERQKEKGNRQKKKQRLKAEASARSAEKEALLQERLRAQRENESDQMARARALQIQQLIRHHQVTFRPGNEPYWHVSADRTHLHKLMVPASIALGLREGQLTVVVKGALDDFNPIYTVIPSDVAERIRQHEPERILN